MRCREAGVRPSTGSVGDAYDNALAEPLRERGLEKRIRWCSAKEFGQKEAFGPHRFRYGIATHGPMEDPENPGISAAVLGITPRVDSVHYNRGPRASAAKRFHQGLRDERRGTEGIAERHFGGRLAGGKKSPTRKKGEEAA